LFNFLICSERSGSNFITNLIGANPSISAPPPTHMFRLFANNEKNYGDLIKEDNWKTLIRDVVENFNCKLGIWNTSIDENELYEKTSKRTSAELLKIIYQKEASSEGASQIFIKENYTYSFVNYLISNFKDCRFIYMTRDPRDVASSWVSTSTIPGGVKKATDVWHEDQQNAMELYDSLIKKDIILHIRYEDILENTEHEMARICRHLNVAYSDDMIQFHKNARTKINARRIEAWENLKKPVIKDNKGKYKTILKDEDIKYIELRCFNLMRRWGYEIDFVENDTRQEERSRIKELENYLTKGVYIIGNEKEENIRKDRLNAINLVLERKLV